MKWIGCHAGWFVDREFLSGQLIQDGLSTRLANLLHNGFLASLASLYRMG
jgi:hypothetical protein